MIRILLVDDQYLFAESLKMMISNYADDMDVIGIASDGEEAIRMSRELKPDVILMDVYMKRMNGVRATKIIHHEFPDIRIIVLSTYGGDENVREALLSGASGYLMKDISPTELLISIRSFRSGNIQISPAILQSLIKKAYVDVQEDKADSQLAIMLSRLTKREREVFSLIATGYENERIAEELYLSEQTVRNYVSSIYDKLGVKDRFEIIRLANRT